MAQKITPHLWFDKEAKEAAAFYTSLFDNSKVTNTTTITGTPSGDCDIVSFELHGQSFMAISAGPYFKFTPAISFIVNFDPVRETSSSNGAGPSARAQIDKVWEKLAEGGKGLMEIGEDPFSKRYGGSQPKADGPRARALGGKESKMGAMMKYPAGSEAGQEGTVMFADFKLLDTWLAVMDSAGEHRFDFNEAVSFIVNCDDQAEIDYYWEKLSAVPESEQCGWLKDKYGVSWQIVPTAMNEMVKTKDKKALARVTEAFLKMKKFDISGLQKAYEGA